MRLLLLTLLISTALCFKSPLWAVETPIACDACVEINTIVEQTINELSVFDPVEKDLEELVVIICEHINGAGWCLKDHPETCSTVCKLMITEEAPIILDGLFTRLMAPLAICTELIPVCDKTADLYPTQVYKDDDKISNVGSSFLIHISDIHVDPNYVEGSSIDCGFPECCRSYNGKGNSTHYAGKFGPTHSASCDIPMATVDSMLMDINQVITTREEVTDNVFIIITGDFTPHDVYNQSKIYEIDDVTKLFNEIADKLPRNIPIFPCLGNHEIFPVNEFKGPVGDAWLYNAVSIMWSRWLPDDALSTIRYGGYYTTVASPKLRIIALNSGLYQADNIWLEIEELGRGHDVAGQIAWFQDVMQQADKMNEAVYIIAHVSFGLGIVEKSNQYIKIICQYSNIVKNVFFGHTHDDQFNVQSCENTDYLFSVRLAPSITTYQGHFPSWRLLEYNNTDTRKDVIDYEQRYLNLAESEASGNGVWETLYKFKSIYNIQDSSSETLRELAFSFLSDDLKWKTFQKLFAAGGSDQPQDRVKVACESAYLMEKDVNACILAHKPSSSEKGIVSSYIA